MKRLEYDADTREDVINYFQTRARQLLPDGFVWQKDITEAPGGLITSFVKDNEVFKSYYCYASERGKGHSSCVINSIKERIVTSPDCHIEDFLKAKKKSYVLGAVFSETVEYKAIQAFYNDQKANRSQCYLMNHIDEALFIMTALNASDVAKRAFCLHPLVQNDQDLAHNWDALKNTIDPEILALAMEYRNIANSYLSHRKIKTIKDIALSPIADVNAMLIGDKVQNYKDFLIYHYGTHDRSNELDKYFKNWLKKLDISQEKFEQLYLQLKEIEFLTKDSIIENKTKLEILSELADFEIKYIRDPKEIRAQSAGFRRCGMKVSDFAYLSPMNKICDTIISKAMNTDYKVFNEFLTNVIHKQLSAINFYDGFTRKYAVFQLKGNDTDFTNIEYYELCYSTNSTESGHLYYLFRFYVDNIEPSCVVEQGVSQFPYMGDTKEANRPKIIISTHYKDFSKMSVLFLQNYKREISKKLGVATEIVNEDTVNLINMIAV